MDSRYDNALKEEGRDLVRAAREGSLRRPRFRDGELSRLQELVDKGGSVLLVGPAGVGKTALIHGLAFAFAEADDGRGLIELATSTLLSGTRYLGEWQSKLQAITQAAMTGRVVLFLSDVWNLSTAGRTSNSDTNVLDAIRPLIEQGRLSLLGEVSPELLQQMERVPRFADLFQRIEVAPLSQSQVDQALAAVAAELSLPLDAEGRRALVQLTRRFLPARPQPGPALTLLSQVAERAAALPPGSPVPPAFVEQVFADRTGLPPFIVSREATMRQAELRAAFQEHLVGQAQAIDAVLECIALFKAGLQDPDRPLGTFLFVGPTGVGKTELARTLATILFGSRDRLLRFDLAEYKDYHSFEMLLGNAREPGRPAGLVDPVRSQPFQVILFDELEKAHPNVWDVLLGLLDEGRLTPPSGQTVDFRSTIVICTSNVGAEGSDKRLGFGEGPDEAAREAAVLKGLEKHFRPELLNRFQRLVVFQPLSRDQVRAVARHELARILAREGIQGRQLVVDVDDAALDLVIERGYDERYGARALKRELQRQIVLPLAVAIMEQGPELGQLLRVDVAGDHIRVRLRETRSSREQRRERKPVAMAGRKWTRAELATEVQALRERARELAGAAGEAVLQEERDRLRRMKLEHDFWRFPREAARALRDLDRAEHSLARLSRLRERAEECAAELLAAASRDELKHTAQRLESLHTHLQEAWRELVVLGGEGAWDALVELRPVGGTGPVARDLVSQLYLSWARTTGAEVDWLQVPADGEAAALLAIKGPYCSGLLKGEAGLHRFKDEDGSSVCRVRVGPWLDLDEEPVWGPSRAVKAQGSLGQRVRSELEVRWRGQGRKASLVLRGDRSLEEARQLAIDLLGAWTRMPGPSERPIRRYDASAGQVKDHRLGILPTAPARLAGDTLHQLLLDRLDGDRDEPSADD